MKIKSMAEPLSTKAPFTFGHTNNQAFGKTIKFSSSSRMNTSVLSMFANGIMDLHGHILPTKVSEEQMRLLWKYIQYLWVHNPGHDTLAQLATEDGTGNPTTFLLGVRRVLGLDASEPLTVQHLLQFINELVIDVGINTHPVLEYLHEQFKQIMPTAILGVRTVVEDPNAPGRLVDLASSLDDDERPTLTVKLQ